MKHGYLWIRDEMTNEVIELDHLRQRKRHQGLPHDLAQLLTVMVEQITGSRELARGHGGMAG